MRKKITDFRKKSFIILMITLLISVPFQVFAADDPVWTAVGPAGFSAGSAYNIALALNGSGQPCIFFADNANGNRATVMQFNGTDWTVVGTPGFSADSVSNALHALSLAFDSNGNPYVAYRDNSADDKATVMHYNGSAWVPVGPVGFSPGAVQFLFLAIDSQDTLYVAFQDGMSGNKATVMRFDGTAWVPVGSAGISGGTASFTTLDFDRADMPYLSYQDGANSNSLTVQTYTAADGWQILGQAAFSPGAVNFPVIQLNGLDVPYVAFTDLFNGYEASAMRFNGTTWEQVGNPAFSQGISFSMPWYLSLAFDQADNPYVAYAAQRVYVFRYSGSWQPLGTLPLTDFYSDYTAMAIAADNTVFVGFTDGDSTGGNAGKATVMRYAAAAQPSPTQAAPTPTEVPPTPTEVPPTPTEAPPTPTEAPPTPTEVPPTPTTPADEEQNPKTGHFPDGGLASILVLTVSVLLIVHNRRQHRPL